MRVEIPAYTDAWMQGDRYGEVIETNKLSPAQCASYGVDKSELPCTMHKVKLDKTGRKIRVIAADCKEV